MKIVVIGGSGRVGSNVVRRLAAQGHDAVPASPATGVDTITGEGLADVMAGADVVVDVSNAPVWEDDAVLEFFTTSTRNLLAAERAAGVGHHLAVSIVGADRLPDSGYLRAKVAQEAEIEAGDVPYTILRATQFFEFLPQIVEAGAEGDGVRLSDRADAARRRRRRRRDRGRAGDRRAGRRPRRARRARGAGHRRLGAAPVRRHRRRPQGHRRPARALLRHRAARRRADARRRRPHRGDRLRPLVRRPTRRGPHDDRDQRDRHGPGGGLQQRGGVLVRGRADGRHRPARRAPAPAHRPARRRRAVAGGHHQPGARPGRGLQSSSRRFWRLSQRHPRGPRAAIESAEHRTRWPPTRRSSSSTGCG